MEIVLEIKEEENGGEYEQTKECTIKSEERSEMKENLMFHQ